MIESVFKVPFDSNQARDAIVRVGDGRGCLLALKSESRIVLTAAHCLPRLPPADPFSYTEERTFDALLGPLETAERVAAECLYVRSDRRFGCRWYARRSGASDPSRRVQTTSPRHGSRCAWGCSFRPSTAWLLTLEGQWRRCAADICHGRTLTLIGAAITAACQGRLS